jgi:signal peptidase II
MQAATLLLTAILLIALDQASKALVISRLHEGQAVALGPAAIRRVRNRRTCVGVFRSEAAVTAIWAAEIVLLAAMVQFGPFFQGAVPAAALGAALGGAGSNLFDRLWRDGVIDIVDVGFWPVFNLADVAIVIGAVIGLLYI